MKRQKENKARKGKKEQVKDKNYLLMFCTAMVCLLVVLTGIDAVVEKRTQKKDFGQQDFGRYVIEKNSRLSDYYAFSPQEYALDQTMAKRGSWSQTECWISNDLREYSEEAEKYENLVQIFSESSPGYVKKYSGLDCLEAFSNRRNFLFMEYVDLTTGQVNLDMEFPGLREYYAVFPEEETKDREMLKRENYDGNCWVSENYTVYQEFPQQSYQVPLEKKFGAECFEAYAQRRNKLFLRWQAHQENS